MIEIINLTPHAIILFKDDKIVKIFPPKGIARIETKEEVLFYLGSVPVKKIIVSQVFGLPEEKQNVYYIVSRFVAENAKRKDLIIPNDSVRNEKGVIIGCRNFAVVYWLMRWNEGFLYFLINDIMSI